ncbi:InlB B-repeat-containing protein, partial [Ruminococcaceae bacterium OttesenSCG-928-A16]|nr:InlB B-repeat-containing protein [Ruminococcaceae bacterium OttesenSCG-928-A16]
MKTLKKWIALLMSTTIAALVITNSLVVLAGDATPAPESSPPASTSAVVEDESPSALPPEVTSEEAIAPETTSTPEVTSAPGTAPSSEGNKEPETEPEPEVNSSSVPTSDTQPMAGLLPLPSAAAPPPATPAEPAEPAKPEEPAVASFAVTFLGHDGTPFGEMQTVPQGGFATQPADAPTHPEGAAFLGWALEGEASLFNFSATPIVGPTVLWPVFETPTEPDAAPEATQRWTISFVSQGGLVETKEVPNGTTSNPSAVPALPEGAVSFLGWFENEVGTDDAPFDFSTLITKHYILYARFASEYLVQFTNADGLVVDTLTLAPDTFFDATTQTITPPAGTRFMYWYETDPSIPFSFPAKTTRNLVLKPYFSNVHYVHFYSEGTQVKTNPRLVPGGQGFEKPEDPTRDGYQFLHWSTTPNGSPYNFALPVTADFTLYAVWQAKTVGYKIAYWLEKPNIKGDPGTNPENYEFAWSYNVSENKGVLAGKTVQPNAATANGYLNGTGQEALAYSSFRHSEATTINGNGTTVVNVYYARTQYTLTFDLNSIHDNSTYMTAAGKKYTAGGQKYVLQAKYEQYIGDAWPTDLNHWIEQFIGWKPQNGSIGGSTWTSKRLIFVEDMIPKNTTQYTLKAQWSLLNYTFNLTYYMESVNGKVDGAVQYKSGGKWYLEDPRYTETVYGDSGNFTPKSIEGMQNVEIKQTGLFVKTVKLYYDRRTYNLTFDALKGRFDNGQQHKK